jgi:hypothetical protein
MILYSRWERQYRIVCPPPTPKKTPAEVRDAKDAKKQGVTIMLLDADPPADQMGVMYHEYDLMFHYHLASLRCADGVNSVTSKREKLFDVFAGVGRGFTQKVWLYASLCSLKTGGTGVLAEGRYARASCEKAKTGKKEVGSHWRVL